MLSKVYNCTNWQTYVALPDEKLLQLCTITYHKGSGRGGQKRNKTSNAVQLTFFHIQTQESAKRSLALNLKLAVRKLRFQISLDTTPDVNSRPLPAKNPPIDHKLSDLNSIKQKNRWYPFFCGWLLDSFIAGCGDWKLLAKNSQLSSTQLSSWFSENPIVKQKLLKIKSDLK